MVLFRTEVSRQAEYDCERQVSASAARPGFGWSRLKMDQRSCGLDKLGLLVCCLHGHACVCWGDG